MTQVKSGGQGRGGGPGLCGRGSIPAACSTDHTTGC